MIVYRLFSAAKAAVSVCAALTFSLLLSGCVSGGGRDSADKSLQPPETAAPTAHPAEAALLADPARISTLAAPEGISIKLWNEMTAELERVVKRRQIVGSRRASTGAGTPAPYKSASAATDAASRTTLVYDEEADTLSFAWFITGDYDQNGLVGISDLTPLGAHFGKTSGSPGEPFPAESIESVVDGDGNGLIGIADITPIGAFFGERQLGYRVYRSLSMDDWPEDGLGPNGSGAELVSELPLDQASSGANARRVFSLSAIEPPAEGQLFYWTRGYDDTASEGIASLPVMLGPAPDENIAPIAVLQAEPTDGFAPLEVEFLAFSSGDIDGIIVEYEWDFDGPIGGENWVSSGNKGFIEHSYAVVGDYLATLRVTDDDGASATDTAFIRVREPIAPTAALSADSFAGSTPLKVVWDASASDDADGLIEQYEWDFDNDGIFEFSSGDSPTTPFHYYGPGEFTVGVRVTDNDGLSAQTTAGPVVVSLGAQWHTSLVLENTSEVSTGSYGQVATLEINGRPAIFFGGAKGPSVETQTPYLGFIKASNQQGTDWGSVIPVMDSASQSPAEAIIVVGQPAIAIGNGYLRATEPSGNAWSPPPIPVADGIGDTISEMVLLNGSPAALTALGDFFRATDERGNAWTKEESPLDQAAAANVSLAVMDGRPAIAWFVAGLDDLRYARALDPNGSDWPFPSVVESEGNVGRDPELVDAGGLPGIAFHDANFQAMRFIRALDLEGNSWSESIVLDRPVHSSGAKSMTLMQAHPAIVYSSPVGALVSMIANDEKGSSWSFPVQVLEEEKGAGHWSEDLTVVGDSLAFSYETGGGAFGEATELKYANYR